MDLEYSAGLMSQSFWFLEFKKMVKLRNEGLNFEEIKKKCLGENLFGAINENRALRMANYLLNRLKTMDDSFVELFCSADLSTQKLINLITVLRNDRMFFEFMYEVYREKVMIGVAYMEDMDVNVFITKIEKQNQAVENWKDTTKRKLKCVYLNFMLEANLLVLEGKEKKITSPILDDDLTRYLINNGEEIFIKAFTGVN